VKPVSLLVGIYLFLYIVPLGVRPLIIPDETRYAEVPREMLTSGDWIVPRLDGFRYFEKPVLGYWLNAISIRLFGENAFAVRLPTALAAGLAALLLGVWASRYAARKTIGPLAAGVFLLSFEVFIIGTFNVLDGLFSLFVTATISLFYLAYEPRRRWMLLIASGVCCGLAFLTKGPLGVVLPAMVLAPFAIWAGRIKATLKIFWLPCIAAVLVALPWSLMIHRREPDFWHYFFWVEHISRFLHPDPGQHAKPLWFYLPILIGGIMPWTPLVGTIIQGLRHAGLKDPMIRLALCWFVLPFLFFSASSGKLGTYILVCFPPLAFLIAVGLLQCLGEGDTKGFVTGSRIVAIATGLLLCVLIVNFFVRLPRLPQAPPTLPWLLTGAGLFAWCVLALAAVSRESLHERIAYYWLAPVLFLFSLHFVVGVAAANDKVPGAFLLSHADYGTDRNCAIVCDDGLAASVCWFYKRADVFLLNGIGEYEYGIGYDDSKPRYLPDAAAFNSLLSRSSDKTCVALIMPTDYFADFESKLPPPAAKIIVGDLVFARFTPSASITDK
jgi:4-amino-4-deoxy-L-arabinose transferase